MAATSPAVAGATSDFNVILYASLDTSWEMENSSASSVSIDGVTTKSLTFDAISYPYDFWINYVNVDIYDRQVRAAGSGRLFIYYKPTIQIMNDGFIKIIFPEGFDLTSTSPRCYIG